MIDLVKSIPEPVKLLRQAAEGWKDACDDWRHTQEQIGLCLRSSREPKMSLRSMAKLLEVSPAFLSDLETGRRDWSETRILQFLSHIKP